MSYRCRNVIIGIAFIAVLIAFSIAFWKKKETIEAVQGWDTNVTESTYIIWFDCITTEKDRENYLARNPDYKLPVLVIYFGNVIDYTAPKLTIYVVIWEDGTILWGAPNESKPIIRDVKRDFKHNKREIKYFMSKIDSDKVNELLLALEDSLVLLDNLIVFIGGGRTHLGFRSEKARTVGVDSIDALPKIFSALITGRIPSAKSALAWKRMVNQIFNMIPSESRPVNISYSKYDCDEPFSWIGIIEIPASPYE